MDYNNFFVGVHLFLCFLLPVTGNVTFFISLLNLAGIFYRYKNESCHKASSKHGRYRYISQVRLSRYIKYSLMGQVISLRTI